VTPIDWNDSEPAFPDFLPPLQKRELTREEVVARLDGVLKANGITVSLQSCGCCGGVEMKVSFPDGAVADLEHFNEDLGGEFPRR
jgi:hypothetical protein